MFGDSSYIEDSASEERFRTWQEAIVPLARQHGWKVAILEVAIA